LTIWELFAEALRLAVPGSLLAGALPPRWHWRACRYPVLGHIGFARPPLRTDEPITSIAEAWPSEARRGRRPAGRTEGARWGHPPAPVRDQSGDGSGNLARELPHTKWDHPKLFL